MIKLSMFKKLGNFNKFTKLSKDFGELNDKLIIHYHHIYIWYFDIHDVFKF